MVGAIYVLLSYATVVRFDDNGKALTPASVPFITAGGWGGRRADVRRTPRGLHLDLLLPDLGHQLAREDHLQLRSRGVLAVGGGTADGPSSHAVGGPLGVPSDRAGAVLRVRLEHAAGHILRRDRDDGDDSDRAHLPGSQTSRCRSTTSHEGPSSSAVKHLLLPLLVPRRSGIRCASW